MCIILFNRIFTIIMTILTKYKIFIKNNKLNLHSILNIKLKSYNININLLNKIIMEYNNKYKLNIFIIYIYTNKSFKIIYTYSIYILYYKYFNNLYKLYLLYKIVLYKKIQLLFYTIIQLINIIHNYLQILKFKLKTN